QTHTAVAISLHDALPISILGVGQRSEQIQVEANAGLVETRNVGVGQTMEFRRILELPLNGRMVTELITLGGGAVDIPLYASSPRDRKSTRLNSSHVSISY